MNSIEGLIKKIVKKRMRCQSDNKVHVLFASQKRNVQFDFEADLFVLSNKRVLIRGLLAFILVRDTSICAFTQWDLGFSSNS